MTEVRRKRFGHIDGTTVVGLEQEVFDGQHILYIKNSPREINETGEDWMTPVVLPRKNRVELANYDSNVFKGAVRYLVPYSEIERYQKMGENSTSTNLGCEELVENLLALLLSYTDKAWLLNKITTMKGG